jgi:hypothetical protein
MTSSTASGKHDLAEISQWCSRLPPGMDITGFVV